MRNCIVSILFFYLSIGWVSSQEPFQELFSTEKVPSIVRRANVAYDSVSFQSGIPHVPLYIANGIVGGSFDHMGFQSRPNTGMPHGRTALGYIGHYDLADHGSHVQFPLAIIDARFADGSTILNLMDAHDYKQELDVYTGTLNTAYDLFGKTTINSFAHQAIPNLFVMKIDRKTSQRGKELVLTIECDASGAQNNHFNRKVDPVTVDFDVQEDLVRVKSKTDITETNWIIQCTGAGFETNGTTLTVKLQNGQNLLKVLVKRDDCPGEEVLENSYEDLYQLHSKAWEDAWQTSWVDFPDDVAQDTWTRMKYYTICNFPPLTEKPMIPTGLNSNIWGFTFPQDVYYVAENLPRLGHFERSEKALQYWLDIVPEIKRYCERIIGVEGVYYPWEMPFQDIDKFEIDGVKGPNSYQLHNQAYVAAMVWHYYEITKDQAFLEKYFPILEEIWQFYANITFLDDERGTFDIYHEHSRGQDEAS
ncbi:MAG: glycosyl hydrolase family 95 catalytic domain-containing protein, partial [Bacteroidota bacterium]